MNGVELVLDTNVVIGFLGGRVWAMKFIRDMAGEGASFAVSQITRMELLAFPEISPDEAAAVREFLVNVEVLPLTESVEDRAIHLRRTTRIKLPDAIIAATAMERGASLVTADETLAKLHVSGLAIINPCP